MADLLKPTRRGFLLGAAAILAAPAIVQASSLMPIRMPRETMIIGANHAAFADKVVWTINGQDAYGRLVTEIVEFDAAKGFTTKNTFKRIFDGDPMEMMRFSSEEVLAEKRRAAWNAAYDRKEFLAQKAQPILTDVRTGERCLAIQVPQGAATPYVVV